MLIELIAYYIGAPLLATGDSFWIYTNLNKESLAHVIHAMKINGLEINEKNLLDQLKILSSIHDWIRVASLEEFMPIIQVVDSKLN